MRRATLIGFGTLLGLAFAVAILGLFMHRPPECGEPAACGDSYLFPVIYYAGLALTSTVVIAAIQAKKPTHRYILTMASWTALLITVLAITYAVKNG